MYLVRLFRTLKLTKVSRGELQQKYGNMYLVIVLCRVLCFLTEPAVDRDFSRFPSADRVFVRNCFHIAWYRVVATLRCGFGCTLPILILHVACCSFFQLAVQDADCLNCFSLYPIVGCHG